MLVAGYLAFAALGLTTDVQPVVFWTMLLPLLPLSIVLMGFATWRNVCPLAFFGDVGRTLNRGTQRHVPRWLERGFFVVTFAVLLSMLALRLVATNGDGAWLSGLLIGLALAALATNWIFTGKSWCNFLCPVGLVERIYTEPASLPRTPNSQCARCTACKKSCPDIDQENAYWRDATATPRRVATFAFPGLVLAFYTYYWLRHGDWEAYFDGRWTRLPADARLAFGPGLFFAPHVPAIVAALVTLVAFSAASYGLFVLVEAAIGRFVDEPERRRHLTLALAAFSAFSIFYVFAGAPTLRRLPGGTRTLAFVAPLLGTLFLVKRWPRTRERFVREKGAAKLLRHWPFDTPPPEDPGEVYAWIEAGQHAREQHLEAYASTVRELVADGLVRGTELRLLEGMRKQLGISAREHDKIVARLSEEERELFAADRAVGIEQRAQLEGYEAALTEALLRRASEAEIAELRQAFGVDLAAHESVVARVRGESGALVARARGRLEHTLALHRDLAILDAGERAGPEGFLAYLLLKARDAAVDRVLELLEVVGDGERVRALRATLFAGDARTRRTAVGQLAAACPGAEEIVRALEPVIVERVPAGGAGRDPVACARAITRLAEATDPYLRAGAVWAARSCGEASLGEVIERARHDPDALVRETAVLSGTGPSAPILEARFTGLATIEKMHFLRSVPLLAGLDPEDLHDLCLLAEEEIIAPPRVLCEQGDTQADALFILVDGRASVVLRADEGGGEEREVAVLGPGEVIGELALLDGSPRSATVRPDGGPVRVLRIPGSCFRDRLLPRPRVAQPLLATLAQRIRDLSRRVGP